MLDAARRGMAVDGFVILTGTPTWATGEALRQYRETSGVAAKLVTVAMTASHSSLVDSGDALQMNVAGLDAAVPAIVKAFLDIP